jgi:ribosomal protein S18 acetylase RimI-like enzyme
VASVLLKRLLEICHERGCREMFVLADQDNDAALATYRRAHAGREPDPVLFLWSWPGD